MFTDDQLNQLRQVIREETKPLIQEELKSIKKSLQQIKKTQDALLDMLDLEQARQSKKIQRLEKHLDLKPLEFVPGSAQPV